MRANWDGVMSELYKISENNNYHKTCMVCGSWVDDMSIHDNWHSGLLEGFEEHTARLAKQVLSYEGDQ